MDIDPQTVLTALLAGGGIAGIIAATAKAKVDRIAAESQRELSNLQGCLKLVEEQRERINQLESQVNELQDKLISILATRRAEDKENMETIATMRTNIADLKAKLSMAEVATEKQDAMINQLMQELKSAEQEINTLRKRLEDYENGGKKA